MANNKIEQIISFIDRDGKATRKKIVADSTGIKISLEASPKEIKSIISFDKATISLQGQESSKLTNIYAISINENGIKGVFWDSPSNSSYLFHMLLAKLGIVSYEKPEETFDISHKFYLCGLTSPLIDSSHFVLLKTDTDICKIYDRPRNDKEDSKLQTETADSKSKNKEELKLLGIFVKKDIKFKNASLFSNEGLLKFVPQNNIPLDVNYFTDNVQPFLINEVDFNSNDYTVIWFELGETQVNKANHNAYLLTLNKESQEIEANSLKILEKQTKSNLNIGSLISMICYDNKDKIEEKNLEQLDRLFNISNKYNAKNSYTPNATRVLFNNLIGNDMTRSADIEIGKDKELPFVNKGSYDAQKKSINRSDVKASYKIIDSTDTDDAEPKNPKKTLIETFSEQELQVQAAIDELSKDPKYLNELGEIDIPLDEINKKWSDDPSARLTTEREETLIKIIDRATTRILSVDFSEPLKNKMVAVSGFKENFLHIRQWWKYNPTTKRKEWHIVVLGRPILAQISAETNGFVTVNANVDSSKALEYNNTTEAIGLKDAILKKLNYISRHKIFNYKDYTYTNEEGEKSPAISLATLCTQCNIEYSSMVSNQKQRLKKTIEKILTEILKQDIYKEWSWSFVQKSKKSRSEDTICIIPPKDFFKTNKEKERDADRLENKEQLAKIETILNKGVKEIKKELNS